MAGEVEALPEAAAHPHPPILAREVHKPVVDQAQQQVNMGKVLLVLNTSEVFLALVLVVSVDYLLVS